MKRIQTLGILMLLVSINVFAQTRDGVVKGIKYSIKSTGTAPSPKIKKDNVVTFNFTAKTDKDSVLQSSYTTGQPAKIQILPSPDQPVDLMDIFVLLGLNDEVVAKIPTDSMFKGNDAQRPAFFPKGSSLVYTIKIEKVQTLEEAMAERDKVLEGLKSAEKDSIKKYLTKNKLAVTTTASGLNYIITTPSVRTKVAAGDTVLVNYIGKTIDGKVFDSSIKAEADKAGLVQPGRPYEPITVVVGSGMVITGWDEGLALLNEGSKATFIIPSDLAYGPQGKDPIPGFATLIFDLEVVKVKPAKK